MYNVILDVCSVLYCTTCVCCVRMKKRERKGGQQSCASQSLGSLDATTPRTQTPPTLLSKELLATPSGLPGTRQSVVVRWSDNDNDRHYTPWCVFIFFSCVCCVNCCRLRRPCVVSVNSHQQLCCV
jgi:hypothetical protein